MKPVLLNAYVAMMPRLQAEEDLRLVSAFAAASGVLKPDDSRDYLRGLERAVGARPQRATRAGLKAAGIQVEEVTV